MREHRSAAPMLDLALFADPSFAALMAAAAILQAGAFAHLALVSLWLPPHRAGVGSGAVNTFRQLGLAVGLAVLGTVFAGRVATVLSGAGTPDPDPTATTNALAGGRAEQVVGSGDATTALVHQAFAAGLDRVFTVAGVGALVAAVVVGVWVRPAVVAPEPVVEGAPA